MAQTIYTYSIINDTFSGTIIPDLLQDEILTTVIATAIEYILTLKMMLLRYILLIL